MRLWPQWYRPPGHHRTLPKVAIAKLMVIHAAEAIGSTPEEITGDRRNGELVAARAAVATVLRERGWSYPRIAASLGGRDHSTIMNACDRLEFYTTRHPRIAALTRSLRFMSMGGL